MDTVEEIYSDLETEVSEEEFRESVTAKVDQMGGLADEETAAMLIAHELETDWEKPLSLAETFRLGKWIQSLQSEGEEDPAYIHGILRNITSLIDQSDFNSPVIEQIQEAHFELDRESFESKGVTNDGVKEIRQKAKFWENILEKELDSEKRLPISSRGLFDVEKAMESPQELFDEEVWEWLPDLPKGDIAEACRCLSIESSTAAVFLSLRAVEECLRLWYEGKEGVEVSGTAWGGVLRELENVYEDSDNQPAVLTNLDYLRVKRNEVNHPDKSPSWHEAEATLYIVRNTISEIYMQIREDS